ncbi:unnamed protein product [Pylaiella littoralis]
MSRWWRKRYRRCISDARNATAGERCCTAFPLRTIAVVAVVFGLFLSFAHTQLFVCSASPSTRCSSLGGISTVPSAPKAPSTQVRHAPPLHGTPSINSARLPVSNPITRAAQLFRLHRPLNQPISVMYRTTVRCGLVHLQVSVGQSRSLHSDSKVKSFPAWLLCTP